MPSVPVVSGRDAVRAFQKLGWEFARQRGSHIVLVKTGSIVSLSVPDHKELAPGTLRKLIRLSGLSVEQFAAFLR